MRAQGTVTRAFAGNAELPPTLTARVITAATIELEVSTDGTKPVLPSWVSQLGPTASQPVQHLREDIEMSKGTKIRTVRIDDALWEAAQAKAAEQGENLSEILRARLQEYVQGD